MNKELEENIEVEAHRYGKKRAGVATDFTTDVCLLMGSILHEAYRAGTRSPALLEWVVSRAVDLAHAYTDDKSSPYRHYEPAEILEIIKAELEGK